jgi:hypothetical protein
LFSTLYIKRVELKQTLSCNAEFLSSGTKINFEAVKVTRKDNEDCRIHIRNVRKPLFLDRHYRCERIVKERVGRGRIQ